MFVSVCLSVCLFECLCEHLCMHVTSVLMIRIENCPDIDFSIRNLMTFPLIMYRIFD